MSRTLRPQTGAGLILYFFPVFLLDTRRGEKNRLYPSNGKSITQPHLYQEGSARARALLPLFFFSKRNDGGASFSLFFLYCPAPPRLPYLFRGPPTSLPLAHRRLRRTAPSSLLPLSLSLFRPLPPASLSLPARRFCRWRMT